MRTFLFLILLGSGLTLASCKTRKETVSSDKSEYPQALLADNFDAYKDNAYFTITAVSLDGNVISISVEYSGGCEKHNFQLIGATFIQKSLPPKRGVMLFHNNNGDSCRSIVEETLKFDISTLAYEGGEIILELQGWETPISYTAVK